MHQEFSFNDSHVVGRLTATVWHISQFRAHIRSFDNLLSGIIICFRLFVARNLETQAQFDRQ